ncbi:MAG: hypothetical protein JW774_05750 [Candidatus Aureabacteria bacterium]|nr:hypothetical protein [Candidatus Auribacterota bacterium]
MIKNVKKTQDDFIQLKKWAELAKSHVEKFSDAGWLIDLLTWLEKNPEMNSPSYSSSEKENALEPIHLSKEGTSEFVFKALIEDEIEYYLSSLMNSQDKNLDRESLKVIYEKWKDRD